MNNLNLNKRIPLHKRTRLRDAVSNHHRLREWVKTADMPDLHDALIVEATRKDGRVRMDILNSLINAIQRKEKAMILDRIFAKKL